MQARDTDLSQPADTQAHRHMQWCELTQGEGWAHIPHALESSRGMSPSGCSPSPSLLCGCSLLGKHLKTERLPGRRKKRRVWNGKGWGTATGRAQEILKLGDYQGWLVPEGSWASAWWVVEEQAQGWLPPVGAASPCLYHRLGLCSKPKAGKVYWVCVKLRPLQRKQYQRSWANFALLPVAMC